MNFSVQWTHSALSDLSGILDYFELDSAQAAASVYKLIRSSCAKQSSFPKSGRIVPELKNQNIELYREVIASHWRVIYSVQGSKVYIITILDSRRELDFVLISRALGLGK